ncbi:DUF4142 domain-containing protein [Sphingomonas sp. LHG3406-1]|uniref:DUF4142 domain-containing protein n=1 Tax=Sphingomonas sp. LHG3406-1 TaxID=2804617 RepID=UPI00261949EF|nr:DUF4142 domain-containing protein [Sphingomonas sp. LHG3406-1]
MRKLLPLFALLLAGCATKAPMPVPAPRPAPSPVQVPGPALTPVDYVTRIASIEQFVARACALGLERTRDPALRNRLEALATDHRGLSAQLRMAGQRVNLLPSPRLNATERQWLAMLEASQPFEVGLQRRLLQAHQEAVILHERFAAAGGSPTLRQFARFALAAERDHAGALGMNRFLAR